MLNKILFLLLLILLTSFASADTGPVQITWQLIIVILVGIYEVIVRAIPTVANYSFIGKIIDILAWLSQFLNNKKT